MMMVSSSMSSTSPSTLLRPGDLDAARARLARARRVVALTGAGISAESGVPTFRGADGLWRNHRAEELATARAFARDPHLVWEWYESRRRRLDGLAPNAGHHALARLEAQRPEFLLATQNVDGLHAQAGSRRLVELHGNIWRLRCLGCGAVREERRPLTDLPPRCACSGLLRPDVVWFGEDLPEGALEQAFAAARAAEVVLVVGTSSLVYPAAAVPEAALAAGAFVVEVNPERTPLSEACALALRGPAAEVLPLIVGGAA
jgi:NAD-dependent deacetylase